MKLSWEDFKAGVLMLGKEAAEVRERFSELYGGAEEADFKTSGSQLEDAMAKLEGKRQLKQEGGTDLESFKASVTVNY
jgi:hypothetical protein